MLKKISAIVLGLAMAFMLAMPMLVSAEGLDLGLDTVGEATGLGSGGEAGIQGTIGSIIKAALGFLGVIALVIVLMGGFKYMTSGGDEKKVGDARKYIISGIIGLAIILSSYAITGFVVEKLVSATAGE